jgi:hypothetical protein
MTVKVESKKCSNDVRWVIAVIRYIRVAFGESDARVPLKGLSHEIDFKNIDKNVQNLA